MAGNKVWVRGKDSGLIHEMSGYINVFVVGIHKIDLMINLKKNNRFISSKMIKDDDQKKEK